MSTKYHLYFLSVAVWCLFLGQCLTCQQASRTKHLIDMHEIGHPR